jgi:hypothetical protein
MQVAGSDKLKEEYIPPTYRSVKESHDVAAERMAEIKKSNARIEIEDLALFAASMTEHLSGEDREKTAEMLGRALVNLTLLLEKHPESDELIMGFATAIILVGVRSVEELIFKFSESEFKKARPFLEANRKKSIIIERAKTIADELWQADSGQEYRVTDMAKLVMDILKREGTEDLPAIGRVADWIKPIAPHYARLAGRRRKTP